ncbi:putative Ig domain-containing protein [Pseudomonas sp. NY15463]|uniref:putative Ig domain-containing protein n=1 Tax=Pseudomonas sp. NY15463 TaxID=3400361 RepID=UPI003A848EEC
MTINPNARNRSPRARLALALEPRILLDAAAVATAEAVAAKVDATASTPGVAADTVDSKVTIKDATDSFAPVNLFDNVRVSLDSSNQPLAQLTLQVNSSADNQALVIDGAQIVLQDALAGVTSHGYTWQVSVVEGVSNITLQLNAADAPVTAADVQTVIDNMRYQVLDKSVESSTVTITLKSLTDEGGQNADLSQIKASVTLDNQVNVAPLLSDSGGLNSRETYSAGDLGIGAGSEVLWSADGRFAYVAGGSSVQVFAVDASGALTQLQTYSNSSLGSITDMLISADGTSIYTQNGGTDVTLLSIGSDGKISASSAYSTQNGSISGSLAISDDGQYVYAGTESNDVVVFSRNTDTGALSVFTRALTIGNNRGGVIVSYGDTLFVLYKGNTGSGPTLAVYQRDSEGKLPQQLTNISLDGLTQNSTRDSLVIAPDGKTLYIGDPTTGTITLVRFDGSTLTPAGSVSMTGVSSLAISDDGRQLYAASSNGALNVYQVDANGNLTLTSNQASNTTGQDIALSSNGSLLVTGDNTTRYTRVQALNLGQANTFGENLSFRDANFEVLDNYKGTRITVDPSVSGGSFGLADGNGLTLDGSTVKHNDVVIGTFSVGNDGTLTVTFTADTPKAVANQVLQQLTYRAASNTVAGSLMTLQVAVSDGLLASGVLSLTLRANSVPVGNVGSYTPPAATSETAYSTVLPSGLFSDADGDALVWSVSGLPEGLSFDHLTRTISGTTSATGAFDVTVTVTDASGQRAAIELTLEVAQIANRAPELNPTASDTVLITVGGNSVTLDQDLFSDQDKTYGDTLTWAVEDLPAGLSFDADTRTISGTAGVVGDHTITVTVTDSAGASTRTELTLRIISEAEAANSKPAIEVDSSTLVYTHEGGLSGFSDYVYSVEVSDDGRTVFVLGNSNAGHAITPGGNSTLYVYSRNADSGALSLIQRIVQGTSDDGNAANGVEVDGLLGAASAVYSADGQHVYVVGQKAAGGNYVVSVFDVNADGSLTATGQSLDAGSTQIKQMVMAQDGSALYAVAGNTLLVFRSDADGVLSAATVITDSTFNTAFAVATDTRGNVYVVGSSILVVYEADGAGNLTRTAQITGNGLTSFARSVAVSDSGFVYVTNGTSGSILTFQYEAASNTLTGLQQLATGGQVWGLGLSADGKTLFAGTNTGALRIYSIGEDGKPVFVKQVTGTAGRAYRIAVSADGSSIYGGGFFTAGGLAMISVSDAAQLDYTEGQADTIHPGANLGISDVELDALASGAGNYNGTVITLEREGGASRDDVFDFTAGNGLTRVGEQIQLNGATIATLTSADGKITVSFTADTTTAVANQVLRQIAYTNTSNDPQASVSLKLTFQDDYKSGTTTRELRVQIATVNDAPVVSGTAVDSLQEPGKDSVKLFDASAIDAVEASQTITRLTFTVSGVQDAASETLNLDGTPIALVAGSGVTAGGLSYSVTLSDGTATVVLGSSAGISASAAAAVVDGARYANNDASGATLGVRSITLSAVKDSGGTANGGSDTTSTTLTAQVNVSRRSPVLGADIGALELAERVQSGDWPDPYAGINGVVSIGDQVYVLRSTSEWVYDESTGTGGNVNFSTLYVFTRASDGSLSLSSTVEATASNGLGEGSSGLGLSNDGKTVYLSTDSHGIAVFSRDSSSGALTALGTFAADAGLANDVQVLGNTAYLSSDRGLLVFTRSGDSWTQTARFNAAGADAWYTDLQLSADGKYLYAATSGGSTLVSVYRVGDDGALSLVQHLAGSAGEHYANSLALAGDGQTLYLADGTTLYSLQVGADGSLAPLGSTLTLDSVPKTLLVSSDGSALIVVGESQLSLYHLGSDGSLGAGQALSIANVNLNEIRSANFSADATQLYLTGNFGNEGLLVLDLTAKATTYIEDGDAVAVLPGGTLHDPQLDALNGGLGDYDGASIVIARDGGDNAEDVFSLLAGSGLTLQNGQVLLDGQAIATFVQSTGTLTLTFIASVSQANAQQVLRSIAYRNTSQDPASSASLRVQLNDGEGYRDSRLVELTLEGVNDAPVVDTTGLRPTYNAESEPVKLFENTTIDVVEADQQVWQVVLTLTPAASGDIIGVDGGKIDLDNTLTGVQTSASGQLYTIIRSGGQTQLVLYVNGDVQRAQDMVNSLTYSNSGDNLSGTRSISLSVRDSGGGGDLGSATRQAQVTLAPALSPNTAPTLEASGSAVGYTEQGEAVYLAPDASVGDSQMDAFNAGLGNYDGAVIRVTLGDGHTSSDQLGFKDGNGLSLDNGNLIKDGKVIGTLSVSDGVLTLRFSDATGQIPTTADVQNALRQITYANSSDVPVASVAVTVTLTDQRGLAADSLVLRVNITAVNDAPVLADDPVLSLGDLERVQDLDLSDYGLGTPTTSVVSADSLRVYIVDGQGNIALFSRDDSGALTHVSTLDSGFGLGHLQLSSDGKSLYALNRDGNAILCFSADGQGRLTLQTTVVSQYEIDASALYDMRGLALSDDGKTLFVINAYTVLYFSRDSASGEITYGGGLEASMWSAPHLWSPSAVVTQGDLVFVVTDSSNGSSLIVYRQGSEGDLTLLGYSREGDGALSGLQQVSVSADGKTVYVANDSQVTGYRLDSDSGTLTYLGSVQGGSSITDIAVSADGSVLFVTQQDGTLNRYTTVGNTLSGSEQVGGASHVLITDNGVLVLGNAATVIASQPQDGPQLEADDRTPVLLDPSLTLSDAELDAADDYQGASLSISSQASDSIGLLAGNGYSLDGNNVLLDGNQVATLVRDGNVTTLTFTTALTRAQANALVRQLTWTSSADAPAQPSSHALTLMLNDGSASDALASNSFNIDVTLLPPNQPPVLNEAYADYALTGAQAGTRYSVQLPADLFTDPEGAPLTYSISGLPTGMTFNPVTRTLSGTAPRELGSLNLTLKVTDASGASTTLVLELAVANAVPVADGSYHLPEVSIGQAYQVQLPDSLFSDANDDNLTWQVVGELPEGLQFDPASHTLSGTAPTTPGSYSITLRADDGQGGSTEVTLTLVVANPASSDPVTPVVNAAANPALPVAVSQAASEREERTFNAVEPGNDPLFQPAPESVRHSTLDDGGLASNRTTLARQLANADRIITDSGFQGDGASAVHFDGKTLRAEVDLGTQDGRWVSLHLAQDIPEGADVQRVTLANGLPLPSWASFDARSSEIRIDSRYLQRHGEVRLSLVLRDENGREQRLPLHIRSQGQDPQGTRHATDERPANLSQQLGQQTSGALYREALELLEQLGEWANDDFQHIA